MTDRIIINKFLKNFEVKVITNNFVVIDKITNQELNTAEFSVLCLTVFDTFIIEKDKLPFDVCQEWFTKKKKKYTQKLDGYLANCIVSLGTHDWEVKTPYGEIVTQNSIYELFKNSFSIKYINRYYNNWKTLKILDISESLINQW